MKKILLALSIVISAFVSNAQPDYPLVTPGTKYFSDGDEIYTLKTTFKRKDGFLDVYEVEKQSSKNFMCMPDSLTWLEDRISAVNDVGLSDGYIGEWWIQAWRPKGYNWLAYQNSNGTYKVWAEIKSVLEESFLGIKDSVKTITFRVEAAGIIPEDYTNGFYYKISRKYGIIETKTDHLRQTNGVLERTYGRRGSTVRIVGVTNPKIGWKVLSDSLIYNFSEGDEFHYKFSSTPGQVYPHNLKCSTSTSTIQKVLEKRTKNDSVIYRIQRKTWTENAGCTEPGSSFSIDTMETGFSNSTIALVTNQVNRSVSEGGSLYYQKFTDADSIIHYVSSLCIPYGENLKLAKGLGVVKKSSADAHGGDKREELVYYKKGAKTWGNQIILGSMEESTENSSLSLSPNPASGNFTVTTVQNGLGLLLFDSSGKEKLSVNSLSEGNNKVNISSLEPGFYIYKILSGAKQVRSGKLIVQ